MYVGSLAKLRNNVTRSKDPFSSKSCRKNRAVSMLTPIAAKTMEKLSSCPSWIPFVGAASGFRSVDNLFTNPACRQIWAAICRLSTSRWVEFLSAVHKTTYFVVRKSSGRENRNLLSSGDWVHSINCWDTSLNHLLRVNSRVRVNRSTWIKHKHEWANSSWDWTDRSLSVWDEL